VIARFASHVAVGGSTSSTLFGTRGFSISNLLIFEKMDSPPATHHATPISLLLRK
jgi:hypothetical protein